jgi:endonuclease/exonuclease/phosphatase family metal-dependent hydrolase
MQLTFASYNIHKAVGLDRRRDPDRILSVLNELGADVIALQEADRRFGRREAVLPLHSIGWHGNALLVRRGIEVAEAAIVPLPTLEPRGANRADLVAGGERLRVVGMHLDLSGLRRRQQVRSILTHVGDCGDPAPAVLLGDFNEWARHGGCFREFAPEWQLLAPGRSFPSRRPVAQLDRIVASHQWEVIGAGVHHSALAALGSDHLPVWARLELPKD